MERSSSLCRGVNRMRCVAVPKRHWPSSTRALRNCMLNWNLRDRSRMMDSQLIEQNCIEQTPLLAAPTLEECLLMLEQYGLPRLSKLETGWCARIEMTVSGVGHQYMISSEFKMASPAAAALQLLDRVRNSTGHL